VARKTKTTKAPKKPPTAAQQRQRAARRARAEVTRRVNEMDFIASEMLPILVDQMHENPAKQAWKIAVEYLSVKEEIEKVAKAALLPKPVLRLVVPEAKTK
jgi:hypothetical protein